MSSEAYVAIRRALTDPDFQQSLRSDTTAALASAGISDSQEVTDLQQIISLLFIGASQQTSMAKKLEHEQDRTLQTATEMKLGLKRTLEQIDKAYRSTMRMYEISFFLGVLLVLGAMAMAVLARDPLLPAVFGTLGTLDVLTFFLAKPQERLQASRANLAQLQAALYNWFMDSINLNSKLSMLYQSGRLDEATAVSETLMNHTDRTLEMLQKYCKLGGA